MVNRSKRTLERDINGKNRGPLPDIQGAGGKASEWNYSKLRPWLERIYAKKLSDRPPGRH